MHDRTFPVIRQNGQIAVRIRSFGLILKMLQCLYSAFCAGFSTGQLFHYGKKRLHNSLFFAEAVKEERSQIVAEKPSKGNGQPIPRVEVNLEFSAEQGQALLKTLQDRFEKNMQRHQGLGWPEIQAKLEAQPEKLASLYAMETTGGEPDVVGYDPKTGETIFYDCSPESPSGRRSICYDRVGQKEREKKGVYPGGNAVDLAAAMRIELLNEEQYRRLQETGEFDTKTESWIQTPPDIRKLGGALFCDRRYGHVFVFHNSAPSFYAARGFRGSLRV